MMAVAQRLVVCFDFEGSFGMPMQAAYDLEPATEQILQALAERDARAVFFVVGRLVEEAPQVVQALAAGGHEIGLHGYEHDDMAGYDAARLTWVEQRLGSVCDSLEQLIGRRPTGFRAPYLLGPHFYRADLYQGLRELGFTWVSNRELRYPVELVRPGRLPVPGRGSDGSPPRWLADSKVLLTMLNAGLLARESFGGSATGRLRWLTGERAPFTRDGLVEVPLYSALDCDLLGLPTPAEPTPPALLDYAGACLRAAVRAPGVWSMVTFHDWIVAGGNRLPLLAQVLDDAVAAGSVISTPQHHPEWLDIAA
jgi:peptidoglycan/xylan/chitin deacetylase (PgdA/CDA1 family)